jgi:hypothetical protein
MMSGPAHKTYSAGADPASIIAVAFRAKIDDVAPAQLCGDVRFVAVASASAKPDKQWDSAKVFPEASTWAMLVTGFGALGFAAFRRARSRGVTA